MTKDRLLYYMLDKKKKGHSGYWLWLFLQKTMTSLVDKDDKISKLCILSY